MSGARATRFAASSRGPALRIVRDRKVPSCSAVAKPRPTAADVNQRIRDGDYEAPLVKRQVRLLPAPSFLCDA